MNVGATEEMYVDIAMYVFQALHLLRLPEKVVVFLR